MRVLPVFWSPSRCNANRKWDYRIHEFRVGHVDAPAWDTLKSAASGVYVLVTDPAGVKQAATLAYEKFTKLTPTQQNDLILERGAGISFLSYAGGKITELGAPEAKRIAAPSTVSTDLKVEPVELCRRCKGTRLRPLHRKRSRALLSPIA
jgi:hypothetical protein